jgi:hypothetical protein
MKTYLIEIEGTEHYFKSDASSEEIQQAIEFVKNGEVQLEKVLVAIRMLGRKATPIKLDPVDMFAV